MLLWALLGDVASGCDELAEAGAELDGGDTGTEEMTDDTTGAELCPDTLGLPPPPPQA